MDSETRYDRIGQLERACRERGLPVTVQRRTVLETILDREDHPTADQVCDQVRRRLPAISRASVYRILDMLVELGLIEKICHPGSAARFDPRTDRHHHLVCMRCEAIIDLEDRRFDGLALPNARRYGFEIRDYHIHFRGICADCRRKSTHSQARAARLERAAPRERGTRSEGSVRRRRPGQ